MASDRGHRNCDLSIRQAGMDCIGEHKIWNDLSAGYYLALEMAVGVTLNLRIQFTVEEFQMFFIAPEVIIGFGGFAIATEYVYMSQTMQNDKIKWKGWDLFDTKM